MSALLTLSVFGHASTVAVEIAGAVWTTDTSAFAYGASSGLNCSCAALNNGLNGGCWRCLSGGGGASADGSAERAPPCASRTDSSAAAAASSASWAPGGGVGVTGAASDALSGADVPSSLPPVVSSSRPAAPPARRARRPSDRPSRLRRSRCRAFSNHCRCVEQF